MKSYNLKTLRHKNKITAPRNKSISRSSTISIRTKTFIQKLCYKKGASVDMTQYGFVNDTLGHRVNSMIKPLKQKFDKMIGKSDKITPRSRGAIKQKEFVNNSKHVDKRKCRYGTNSLTTTPGVMNNTSPAARASPTRSVKYTKKCSQVV